MNCLKCKGFMMVGIIACTRRVLTASAELSHQPEITDLLFDRYLMDVGLNVTVIIVLILAVYIVRKRPAQSDPAAARMGTV